MSASLPIYSVIPVKAGIHCSIGLISNAISKSRVGAVDPGFRRDDGWHSRMADSFARDIAVTRKRFWWLDPGERARSANQRLTVFCREGMPC